MEIALDSSNSKFLIKSYQPGQLIINNDTLTQSVIVTPEKLISPWEPQIITELTLAHITELLALSPQIVLIGSGAKLIFPDMAILAPLINAQIGVEVMDTSAACRTFNVLAAEERIVVAALLIR